jgi:hypothetical protein
MNSSKWVESLEPRQLLSAVAWPGEDVLAADDNLAAVFSPASLDVTNNTIGLPSFAGTYTNSGGKTGSLALAFTRNHRGAASAALTIDGSMHVGLAGTFGSDGLFTLAGLSGTMTVNVNGHTSGKGTRASGTWSTLTPRTGHKAIRQWGTFATKVA